MELSVQVNSKMTVKLDVSNQKDLIRQISQLEEVLSNTTCGACKSENTRFVTRNAAGEKNKVYEFFEVKCNECNSRLSLGCHQEGDTLFPKRKNEAGEWLPNSGWVKFERAAPKEETKSKKKDENNTPF